MAPGNIALADDTGVCFIPRTSVAEVLAPARQKPPPKKPSAKAIVHARSRE
jgi:regulator of RNase E activity RraA